MNFFAWILISILSISSLTRGDLLDSHEHDHGHDDLQSAEEQRLLKNIFQFLPNKEFSDDFRNNVDANKLFIKNAISESRKSSSNSGKQLSARQNQVFVDSVEDISLEDTLQFNQNNQGFGLPLIPATRNSGVNNGVSLISSGSSRATGQQNQNARTTGIPLPSLNGGQTTSFATPAPQTSSRLTTISRVTPAITFSTRSQTPGVNTGSRTVGVPLSQVTRGNLGIQNGVQGQQPALFGFQSVEDISLEDQIINTQFGNRLNENTRRPVNQINNQQNIVVDSPEFTSLEDIARGNQFAFVNNNGAQRNRAQVTGQPQIFRDSPEDISIEDRLRSSRPTSVPRTSNTFDSDDIEDIVEDIIDSPEDFIDNSFRTNVNRQRQPVTQIFRDSPEDISIEDRLRSPRPTSVPRTSNRFDSDDIEDIVEDILDSPEDFIDTSFRTNVNRQRKPVIVQEERRSTLPQSGVTPGVRITQTTGVPLPGLTQGGRTQDRRPSRPVSGVTPAVRISQTSTGVPLPGARQGGRIQTIPVLDSREDISLEKVVVPVSNIRAPAAVLQEIDYTDSPEILDSDYDSREIGFVGPNLLFPSVSGNRSEIPLTRPIDDDIFDSREYDISDEVDPISVPLGPAPLDSFDYNDIDGEGRQLGFQIDTTDPFEGEFPRLAFVPDTSFQCSDQQFGGYFADTEASCQVFHICLNGNLMGSFLCPNGTLFNQQFFVCDWWYNVDCDLAPQSYALNERIGVEDSFIGDELL